MDTRFLLPAVGFPGHRVGGAPDVMRAGQLILRCGRSSTPIHKHNNLNKVVYPGHVHPCEDKYPYFIVIRVIITEAVGKIIAITVPLWMRVVLDKRGTGVLLWEIYIRLHGEWRSVVFYVIF